MDTIALRKLYPFYSGELKGNILKFWVPRCLDHEYGGFLNCYDNSGEHLVSHDKYIWSQGRFLWIFSKLATTSAPLFSEEDRERFLTLARSGYAFPSSLIRLRRA